MYDSIIPTIISLPMIIIAFPLYSIFSGLLFDHGDTTGGPSYTYPFMGIIFVIFFIVLFFDVLYFRNNYFKNYPKNKI